MKFVESKNSLFECVAILIAVFSGRKADEDPKKIVSNDFNFIFDVAKQKCEYLKCKSSGSLEIRILEYLIGSYENYLLCNHLISANLALHGLTKLVLMLKSDPKYSNEKINSYDFARRFFVNISRELNSKKPYGTLVTKNVTEKMRYLTKKSSLAEVLLLSSDIPFFPARSVASSKEKISKAKQVSRNIFDLTIKELSHLEHLDSIVSAMSPAASTRVRNGDGYDQEIKERHRYLLQQARTNRLVWLKSQHISSTVAKQAQKVLYKPFEFASLIGLVAPPKSEEQSQIEFKSREKSEEAYQNALRERETLVETIFKETGEIILFPLPKRSN